MDDTLGAGGDAAPGSAPREAGVTPPDLRGLVLRTAAAEAVAGIIRHEVAAPLQRALALLAELAESPDLHPDDPQEVSDLERAMRHVGQALAVIEEVASREGDRRPGADPRPREVGLAAHLLEVMDVLGLGERDVAFSADLAVAAVMADPRHVRQIFRNLLANAVRHGATPLYVEVVPQGGDYVVTVRDGGPGLPPGDPDRLFQPGVRGGQAPGSGLGLSIVRVLSEANGGSARAVPSDVGAAIEVRLPAAH